MKEKDIKDFTKLTHDEIIEIAYEILDGIKAGKPLSEVRNELVSLYDKVPDKESKQLVSGYLSMLLNIADNFGLEL